MEKPGKSIEVHLFALRRRERKFSFVKLSACVYFNTHGSELLQDDEVQRK